jgi:hypothetical protein
MGWLRLSTTTVVAILAQDRFDPRSLHIDYSLAGRVVGL